MARLGVLGSLVWDEIHGRDPLAPPVEEWGGIGYALAALEAALPTDWEVVPLIKVGHDLADRAGELLAGLNRMIPGGRPVIVPVKNNRVTLRYVSGDRRSERMSGGVPGWTWQELGPMLQGIDALHINFISGHELSLETAESVRRGFDGVISGDLHSLFLAILPDGMRQLQSLDERSRWFGCFDILQLNEDEMSQLGEDPMAISAAVLTAGVSQLNVTLGARGVAYVARPGFEHFSDLDRNRQPRQSSGLTARSARLAAPQVDAVDPTGCGDVFGATYLARLLAGESTLKALERALDAASRNATFHGVTGLSDHLRGGLVRH